MSFVKLCYLLLCLLCFWTDRGQTFTDLHLSLQGIEDTMETIYDFLNGLDTDDFGFEGKGYIRNMVKDINAFKTDIEYYAGLTDRWPDGMRYHPVFMYKYIHRWFSIVGQMDQAEYDDQELLDEFRVEFDEHVEFVAGIARLQNTYHISTDELAAGKIGGVKSEPLKPFECFRIGKFLSQRLENYGLAAEWLKQAANSAEVSKRPDYLNTVYEGLVDALLKDGQKRQAVLAVNRWKDTAEKHEFSQQAANKQRERIEAYVPRKQKLQYKNEEEDGIRELCRDNQPQKRDAICRFYDNNRHPQLLLQPARQEVLSVTPYIVVYRDVLTDEQIESVTGEAADVLTSDASDVNGVFKSTFINGQTSQEIQNTLMPVTSQDVNAFRDIEVFNFGFVGHAEGRHDFLDRSGEEIGATVLVYLTDVDFGGYTVFPNLGIKITPTKGSAVFWYNTDEDGQSNPDLTYADCPVGLGDKWTLVQKIIQRACPLDYTPVGQSR